MFREHSGQKTHEVLRQTRSLLETAHKLIVRAPRLSEETKREILGHLNAYSLDYQKAHWKGTGRLANLGLPQFIVTPLRNLKTFLQRT
jgi:hypothetical protein